MKIEHRTIPDAADSIPEGTVHVYSTALTPAVAARDESLLTPNERQRAGRFRMPRVREQFVACRGQLRRLLAGYTGLTPHDVPIQYLDGGKPVLPPTFGVEFNVSHSDGFAVFAISRSRVGVDVERDRTMPQAHDLVERFFSRDERDRLLKLHEPELSAAFFRCWTRKEAILKAVGRGIQSLECCTVSIDETTEPRLLQLVDTPDAARRWQMFAWRPATGIIAAGAVERPDGDAS
jgi:4'-phosphopantetheinyl transferase